MSHKHELNAAWMMRILSYDTLQIGCETCGPQWIATVNWTDRTLTLAWINAPLRVYFDADKLLVLAESDCPTWQPPNSTVSLDDDNADAR